MQDIYNGVAMTGADMGFRTRDYCWIAGHTGDMSFLPHLALAAGFARQAGGLIMKHYGKNIGVTLKDHDQSPVTAADMESSAFLVSRLGALSPGIPVVSEENDTPGGRTYWAVDPLDGTKEFISRTRGFCVKIALIHEYEPVVAAVFCPAQNVLYGALKDGPAVKITPDGAIQRITTRTVTKPTPLKTLFNKKHADPAEYKARRAELAAKGLVLSARPLVMPGLPRTLQVAEGLADAHLACGFGAGPSAGSGFVWDAAPDDLILRRAGGFTALYDGSPLDFSTPRQRMPGYVALGDAGLRARLTRTTPAP